MTEGAQIETARTAPLTILIVDDDDVIVHLLSLVLEAHGYAVVQARSVAEAVERYREGGPQQLVITDLGLTDGNGVALVAQLDHPVARTLFTSGHPRTFFDGTSSAIPPDAEFVQKPFAPSVLVAVVRQLLAATAPPSPGTPPGSA